MIRIGPLWHKGQQYGTVGGGGGGSFALSEGFLLDTLLVWQII